MVFAIVVTVLFVAASLAGVVCLWVVAMRSVSAAVGLHRRGWTQCPPIAVTVVVTADEDEA